MSVSINCETISKFIELNPQYTNLPQEVIISALPENQLSLFIPEENNKEPLIQLTKTNSPKYLKLMSKNLKEANPETAEKLLFELENYKDCELSQFLKGYVETNGVELYDEIKNSDLPKGLKKDLLKLVLGDFRKIKGYKPDLEIQDTQIQNEYYTGEKFNIKFSGQIVNVTNKTTGENLRIDLSLLLGKHKGDDLLYPRLAKNIQSLPAEVLFDLGHEVEYLSSLEHERELFGIPELKAGNSAGRYFSGFDTIFLFSSGNSTIIHELGHAIDCRWVKNTELKDGYGNLLDKNLNEFSSYDEEFLNTFNKCITAYEADGNKRFTEDDIGKFKISEIFNSTYMTLNPQETYTECYLFLMTGDCDNPKLLKKYFTDCLEMVKQDLQIKRKLPSEIRFKNVELT